MDNVSAEVKAELEALMVASDPAHPENRQLRPATVVGWAKAHPDSALYRQFDWDDASAAELYRIEQARNLIRITLTVYQHVARPIRAFLSVPSDRVTKSGYRPSDVVLANDHWLDEMITDCLNKTAQIRLTYDYLEPHLVEFFDELDELVRKYRT